MENIEVSVLLITYNADWKKLKLTLESIIMQQNVELEVIIADDGSEKRCDEQIIALCENYNFKKYQLVNAKENGGTVINLNNAVQHAQGKYAKAISPGDMLYDANTLRDWIDYMEQNQGQLCFGDAVYYNCEKDSKINVIEMKTAPSNLEIFDKPQNRRNVFVDYLLANDTILGASIMMRTDAMKKYLARFAGKVKFAEDFMARIMVFENQTILHLPRNVIWYEYGQGISTAKNDRWAALLYKDFVASNEIIASSEVYADRLAEKYVRYLRKDIKSGTMRKLYKCFLFPGVVYWRMKSKRSKNKTSQNVNRSFIENIL